MPKPHHHYISSLQNGILIYIRIFLILWFIAAILPEIAYAGTISSPGTIQTATGTIILPAGQIFDAIGGNATSLNLTSNGHSIKFGTTSPGLTLSSISYSAAQDRYTFNAAASSGSMAVSPGMASPSANYVLSVDGAQAATSAADISGFASFTYSAWSSHSFVVELLTDTALVLSVINNTKTNNAQLNGIVLNNGQSVTMYALPSSPVTTWNWYSDGTPISNNFNNYTVSFTSKTAHYIKVNATNVLGTSNTLTWQLDVLPAYASTPVPTLNETPANNLMADISNKSFTGFVKDSIVPYTTGYEIGQTLLGNAFYLIIWILIFAMMWIKQGSLTIPMTVGVIFGGLLISFLPAQYQLVAQILIVFGIFGVVYVFYKGRG